MKTNKELIRDAFAEIFITLFNANTDNMQLTFDFGKFVAKFDVSLIDLKEKKEV